MSADAPLEPDGPARPPRPAAAAAAGRGEAGATLNRPPGGIGVAGSDPDRPGPRERTGRRRGPWRWLGRVLLVWLVNTATLVLLARVLPGLAVASVTAAVVATALLGLLNAVLWPLLL